MYVYAEETHSEAKQGMMHKHEGRMTKPQLWKDGPGCAAEGKAKLGFKTHTKEESW